MSAYDDRPDTRSEEALAPGDGRSNPEAAVVSDAQGESHRDQGDRASADGWETPTTGLPTVDEVLTSVQALDGRPVEEHVSVFEQAHERLRRALDPGHG